VGPPWRADCEFGDCGEGGPAEKARQWAAASARTLARRLRRRARDERGLTRSAALAARGKAIRAALAAHWQLGDTLGWHSATMGEAITAAKILKLPKVEELEELCGHGNWGRHAPPPGARRLPAPAGPAIQCAVLESFRCKLFGEPPLDAGDGAFACGNFDMSHSAVDGHQAFDLEQEELVQKPPFHDAEQEQQDVGALQQGTGEASPPSAVGGGRLLDWRSAQDWADAESAPGAAVFHQLLGLRRASLQRGLGCSKCPEGHELVFAFVPSGEEDFDCLLCDGEYFEPSEQFVACSDEGCEWRFCMQCWDDHGLR